MKKNCFQVWISFICIITIISSCNSNEKNTGNPDSGDTTVITKKDVQTSDWTTNTELILGTIQASLKIDGAEAIVDSGKITIRPKADFSAIEITSSQGRLMLKPGWRGMGDYDKAYAEWNDITDGMTIRYSSDNSAPGNMKVTEWADGKVSGVFSVTVIENNALETPKKKLLEGEFRYLHDR